MKRSQMFGTFALALLHGAMLLDPTPVDGQAAPRGTTPTAAPDSVVRTVPTPRLSIASGIVDYGLRALGTDSVRAVFTPRVRVRPPPPVRIAGGGVRPLAVAKWGSLLATMGAAVYGFAASMGADDHYARIEDACAEVAERCRISEADGRYVDPEVDEWDRQAKRLDRRARVGLLASQVGVAASIVLFIVDLRDTGAPPNVPYRAPELYVGASGSGMRVGVRIPAP